MPFSTYSLALPPVRATLMHERTIYGQQSIHQPPQMHYYLARRNSLSYLTHFGLSSNAPAPYWRSTTWRELVNAQRKT
ncbi:uncharacterized protein LY79DRAFT_567620 [Colletotrichum navitas]|uniref:Uncharacterized protein n=1 Tax=Colletotrichum navitas TaxID=681940 RepID=A0AAD8V007_9PEZI|nr:uncharacterized protein LY79DRAFT_567620 [Colletotrichum navitas]KAK1573793.1 hypothetical protein LY79DRAFT_567620 [Colletotrichum navitas]